MVLRGDWTIDAGLARVGRDLFESIREAKHVSFEVSRLRRWDTTLIVFVNDVRKVAQEAGVSLAVDTLPSGVLRLLELAEAVPRRDTGDDSQPGLLERIGQGSLDIGQSFKDQLEFLGEATLSFGRLLVGRSAMRFRDFWVVVEDHGPRALPIVGLISLLVGMIVAFLGSVVLTQFGAGIYSAHLVGFGMFRELGALMTGIIMVGRSGAAFAAEIGSMKVSEELDAYQTLGISAIDFVVLPRMLALFLMMPLLTVFGDLVGVLGGMVVSSFTMDISPRLFLGNLFTAVGVGDFQIGIVKGTVFGGLIAYSGCMRGLQSGKSADAVGKATTSAVVTGITLIIGANAIIDWLASIS